MYLILQCICKFWQISGLKNADVCFRSASHIQPESLVRSYREDFSPMSSSSQDVSHNTKMHSMPGFLCAVVVSCTKLCVLEILMDENQKNTEQSV